MKKNIIMIIITLVCSTSLLLVLYIFNTKDIYYVSDKVIDNNEITMQVKEENIYRNITKFSDLDNAKYYRVSSETTCSSGRANFQYNNGINKLKIKVEENPLKCKIVFEEIKGDINIISLYVDGEEQDNAFILSNNINYYLESYECSDNEKVTWNYKTKEIRILPLNKQTYCRLNLSTTTYYDGVLDGADPELVDGMIPVVIADDGSLTKADLSSDWYNYEEKRWANMVLVNDSSRATYKSANPGTSISTSNVLAYYVWIPRYKYQIFSDISNIQTGVDYYTNNAKEINVVFENNETDKSTGSAKGSWLTHPAFTFGTEELNGIWVGKFETTGDATTPTILPNITSLKSQNVSTQFVTSQKIKYGTTKEASMLKNSEWGAVAYLTGSRYGQGQAEVRINNSSTTTTGCAATIPPGPDNTLNNYLLQTNHSVGYYAGCENAYNTSVGKLASTTGNITGIYDMSGGSWEYVMGVILDSSNSNPLSGTNANLNSGFSGEFGQGGSVTGVPFPDSKYYDAYTYGTTQADIAAYSRGHLGDATIELGGFSSKVDGDNNTRYYTSFNQDLANFIAHVYPWFVRGSNFNHGASTGVFAFASTYGVSSPNFSFRAVIR